MKNDQNKNNLLDNVEKLGKVANPNTFTNPNTTGSTKLIGGNISDESENTSSIFGKKKEKEEIKEKVCSDWDSFFEYAKRRMGDKETPITQQDYFEILKRRPKNKPGIKYYTITCGKKKPLQSSLLISNPLNEDNAEKEDRNEDKGKDDYKKEEIMSKGEGEQEESQSNPQGLLSNCVSKKSTSESPTSQCSKKKITDRRGEEEKETN